MNAIDSIIIIPSISITGIHSYPCYAQGLQSKTSSFQTGKIDRLPSPTNLCRLKSGAWVRSRGTTESLASLLLLTDSLSPAPPPPPITASMSSIPSSRDCSPERISLRRRPPAPALMLTTTALFQSQPLRGVEAGEGLS